MKQPTNQTPRECLFAQRYPNDEDDGEIFIALYRLEGRLLLVTSKERGGDIEVELPAADALALLVALEGAVKK
jgi:hypothetical protein